MIAEMRARAGAFAREWASETREDAERQSFWNDWFEVFGINRRRRGVVFEQNVKKLKGTTGQIDVFWPGQILVEHKSAGADLDAAMEQAEGYLHGLADEELPRLIVLSDFARFRVRNLDAEPTTDVEFAIAELPERLELFTYLAGYRPRWFEDQDEVNVQAAELMGLLHDQLEASNYGGHQLRVLLVRLVFLMFADDTGALGETGAFEDFIERKTSADGSDLGARLAQLFQVLNTSEAQRQSTLEEPLLTMPYVNGQLFSEPIQMAAFNTAMREILLRVCHFNWSKISPAIFGSMFQSVMKPAERHQIGAHYTTEKNILKLIRPLFLDELEAELDRIKNDARSLRAFTARLRKLTFFDPACGCGNFLVIAYRELRALELRAIRRILELDKRFREGQLGIDVTLLAQVNVDQFYGIEVEEFPARIAEVAMYLMDHLANQQLSQEFGQYIVRFPLKSAAHIHVDSALRMAWSDVLKPEDCSYVLGNPPFVAKKHRNAEQAQDMKRTFAGAKGTGELDYVAAWFEVASRYITEPTTRVGFVATNSLVQGEQVPPLWPRLLDRGMQIDFAHRTFQWTSEARGAAVVYVVIVGFSRGGARAQKLLYDYEKPSSSDPLERPVTRINPYLTDGPTVIVRGRRTPMAAVPLIRYGSMPNDHGNLLVEPEDKALVAADPIAAKYLKPLLGTHELMTNEQRWCLWLKDAAPADITASPTLRARVQAVAAHRAKSKRDTTRDLAATPSLFGEIRQPTRRYIAVPRHGSIRRAHLPMTIVEPTTIAHDSMLTVDTDDLYWLGLLQSQMFAAWVRAVGGRIKADPRISAEITYNTFPWPEGVGGAAQDRVRTATQAMLDSRANHAGVALEDLYDPLSIPADLVVAQRGIDRAVDALYGRGRFDELKRATRLFELYAKAVGELTAAATAPRRRRRGAT